MKSAWLDFLYYLKLHPKVAGGIGFFSIYVVWAFPALYIKWNEWFSFAYLYGDHIVLPLFNAVAFWLLAKNKGKIPLWIIPAVLVPGVLLIIFFEPNASAFLEAGTIDSINKAYHSGFVALEFSFIIFMLGIYPFLRGSYAPLSAILVLVLLMVTFLGFVNIADSWLHDFSPVENITPVILLIASYVALVLHRRCNVFIRLKRKAFGLSAEKESENKENKTV